MADGSGVSHGHVQNLFTISTRVCSRGLGRSAALQILAIAAAIAAVCALQPIPIRIPHPFALRS